jgi:hypothetical protein
MAEQLRSVTVEEAQVFEKMLAAPWLPRITPQDEAIARRALSDIVEQVLRPTLAERACRRCNTRGALADLPCPQCKSVGYVGITPEELRNIEIRSATDA